MPTRATRGARAVALAGVAAGSLAVALVADAGPAAAHNVSAGSLPAPSWLLGYVGAFAVLATAAALRSTWTNARLAVVGPAAFDDDAAWADDVGGGRRVGRPGGRIQWGVGHVTGSLLLIGVLYAALVGTQEPAYNVATRAVWIIWWICLPVLCLAAGDLMRWINPFVPVVQWIERMRPNLPSREHLAPAWTAAVFLWVFQWYYLAYYQPGSPRAAGLLLIAYLVAALSGGVFWGTRWLMRGEGFGGLSAGVAGLVRPRPGSGTGALLPICVVLVGTTAFDSVSGTSWWVTSVAGTTTGWARTAISTVGLVWLTAAAGAVALIGVRLVGGLERAEVAEEDGAQRVEHARRITTKLFGVVLLPVALAWFVAHDLTLLLLEGQNFIAQVSDPLGRGWDLFGTTSWYPTFKVLTAGWVRWVQLGSLLAGHMVSVVLAHDGAIGIFGRRRGMRVTWIVSGIASVSIVSAALLVLA